MSDIIINKSSRSGQVTYFQLVWDIQEQSLLSTVGKYWKNVIYKNFSKRELQIFIKVLIDEAFND